MARFVRHLYICAVRNGDTDSAVCSHVGDRGVLAGRTRDLANTITQVLNVGDGHVTSGPSLFLANGSQLAFLGFRAGLGPGLSLCRATVRLGAATQGLEERIQAA